MVTVESLNTALQKVVDKLDKAYEVIDDMEEHMTVLDERAMLAEARLIDLEARSRRNNLIITNIPERDHGMNSMVNHNTNPQNPVTLNTHSDNNQHADNHPDVYISPTSMPSVSDTIGRAMSVINDRLGL